MSAFKKIEVREKFFREVTGLLEDLIASDGGIPDPLDRAMAHGLIAEAKQYEQAPGLAFPAREE